MMNPGSMPTSVLPPLRRLRPSLLVPWLLCAAGGMMAFHPTLLSGFRRMQTDPGDTRFNNYLLEHSWKWLQQEPAHASWWDPPFFFPQKNALALSDLLLGVAPPYWAFRGAGFAPDTAFQLWMVLVCVLNFFAFQWLAERLLAVPRVPAAFGAALFAFAGPRLAQLGHQQLLAQLFVLGTIACLLVAFRGESRWGGAAALGAPLFLLVQFYSGFYMGWFLLLALSIALGWGLALNGLRPSVGAVFAARWKPALAGAVLAALTLGPMVTNYRAAARAIGPRPFQEVASMVPKLQSWFNAGRDNWVYGWIYQAAPFRTLDQGDEHRLGLGLLTPLAVLTGLWSTRRRPFIRVLILTAATLMVLAFRVSGPWTLWRAVYEAVPGGTAIRAVSRVALLLLFPTALGLALLLQRLFDGGRQAAAVLLGTLCLVEQGRTTPSFDKMEARADVERIASRVDRSRSAFFYSPLLLQEYPWKSQMDAMWAQMETGVPTVNGYSGSAFPGWPFNELVIRSPIDEKRLDAALREWKARWPESFSGGIGWVRVSPHDRSIAGRVRPPTLLPLLAWKDALNGRPFPQGPDPIVADGDDLVLTGWAVDGPRRSAAGGVWVALDNALFPSRFPLDRPDVAEHFDTPAYRGSGFEARIPLGGAVPGVHRLSLVVLDREGEAWFVDPEPKAVRILSPEASRSR